jgi:DMSO/TMAO reductase YedYZ molybdopterin-dependent catalytic subunit
MKAHLIENGVVVNSIEVDSLDFMPNLVDGENGGGIGDIYENGEFKKPPIDLEALAVSIRAERDTLLTASDWTQASDIPQATKDKWATYRQALRDIPQQEGFPATVVWPTQP